MEHTGAQRVNAANGSDYFFHRTNSRATFDIAFHQFTAPLALFGIRVGLLFPFIVVRHSLSQVFFLFKCFYS